MQLTKALCVDIMEEAHRCPRLYQQVVHKMGALQCFICHGGSNTAAIRCYLAAGFEFLRNVIEDDTPSKLLVFAS